jgi:hypothetical protein
MKTIQVLRNLLVAVITLTVFSCEKEITLPDPTESYLPDSLFGKVSFNGKMLEFKDAESFAKTYSFLADQDVTGDATGVAHLARFERDFQGFASLRSMVEERMDVLIKANRLTVENNPDDDYLADPILRALLNVDSKILIAGNEIEVTPEFLGYKSSDNSQRGLCCWMYHERNDYIVSPNGTKMIHCKSWVFNVPIPVFWFGIVGSSTRSYHGTPPAPLNPIPVSLISTGSLYEYKLTNCSTIPHNDGYFHQNLNSSFVFRDKWHYTFALPFFVTKRSVGHHADYPTGNDLSASIDFCQ